MSTGFSNTLICDIDGTLADNEQRQHLVLSGKDPGDQFYLRCVDDIPIANAQEGQQSLFQYLSEAGSWRVLYITGRDEICRKETLWWLKKHEFLDGELRMRSRLDSRTSFVVKSELACDIEGRRVLAIDDDSQVLELYQDFGFGTFYAPRCWKRLSGK